MTAPRGLRVGKTVSDDTNTPVLLVFELDYKARLVGTSSAAGPPVTPGAIRASLYAVRGCLMLVGALRHDSKSKMAKFQLAVAFAVVGILMFAALVAVAAALVAAKVAVPGFAKGWFTHNSRTVTAVASVVTVGSWVKFRKQLLGIAATAQQNILYLDDERHRDTVAMTVDDAVNGLRDNLWTGDIHLLGYSFGSLVLFDSLLPKEASHRSPLPVASVKSMTTIGCPIDAVRLFRPDYLERRMLRVSTLTWRNVFIAADVFGSNLKPKDDRSAGPAGITFPGIVPTSSRYLEEELGLAEVLTIQGLRIHGGYWGSPSEANCFDDLVTSWIA
jgi:hypothetical protein